ncbi:hypothetical protein [Arthrobacter sp. N1]|uniref:hypothetical protein n=1 Tax=Arthrobacter sp. N1 TaxID=619291 RepID=UPI003BB14E60
MALTPDRLARLEERTVVDPVPVCRVCGRTLKLSAAGNVPDYFCLDDDGRPSGYDPGDGESGWTHFRRSRMPAGRRATPTSRRCLRSGKSSSKRSGCWGFDEAAASLWAHPGGHLLRQERVEPLTGTGFRKPATDSADE